MMPLFVRHASCRGSVFKAFLEEFDGVKRDGAQVNVSHAHCVKVYSLVC